MASLGHIAVGLAASRLYGNPPRRGRRWILAATLWSLLSLGPDLDVIGLWSGVAYEDEWGHRGATHSIAFSVIAGAAIGAAGGFVRLPALRTAVAASLVLISHALLDMLTDGGLGCALLWPFDVRRYFAPWNPIPVAPIGLDFLSPRGLLVALVELVLFAPLVWVGLSSPERRPRAKTRLWWLAGWLVVARMLVSGDPIREQIVGFVLRDDTGMMKGFSDAALRPIRVGTPEASCACGTGTTEGSRSGDARSHRG